MTARARVGSSIAAALLLAWLLPSATWACSPPFEEPTIAALGPAQVVVVGKTGEPVLGGRVFHVSRWFNGGVPVTPIVIAFKEGEATGDCSYPVAAGTDLIIAPSVEGGRLHADLSTLQADPTSELGRRYLAEATALFGPGVVPPLAPRVPQAPDPGVTIDVMLAIVLVAGLLALILALFASDRRRSV